MEKEDFILEEIQDLWCMESDDEMGGVLDDVIETVARANTVHVSPILPEISATPCPLHTKKDRGKTGNDDPMQRTFSPFRETKQQRTHRRSHPIKNISVQQNATSQDNEQTPRNRIDINVSVTEKFASSKEPALPKHMSSKDYVMTWLVRGSAPDGSNHFPEIIANHSTTKRRIQTSQRRLDTSE